MSHYSKLVFGTSSVVGYITGNIKKSRSPEKATKMTKSDRQKRLSELRKLDLSGVTPDEYLQFEQQYVKGLMPGEENIIDDASISNALSLIGIPQESIHERIQNFKAAMVKAGEKRVAIVSTPTKAMNIPPMSAHAQSVVGVIPPGATQTPSVEVESDPEIVSDIEPPEFVEESTENNPALSQNPEIQESLEEERLEEPVFKDTSADTPAKSTSTKITFTNSPPKETAPKVYPKVIEGTAEQIMAAYDTDLIHNSDTLYDRLIRPCTSPAEFQQSIGRLMCDLYVSIQQTREVVLTANVRKLEKEEELEEKIPDYSKDFLELRELQVTNNSLIIEMKSELEETRKQLKQLEMRNSELSRRLEMFHKQGVDVPKTLPPTPVYQVKVLTPTQIENRGKLVDLLANSYTVMKETKQALITFMTTEDRMAVKSFLTQYRTAFSEELVSAIVTCTFTAEDSKELWALMNEFAKRAEIAHKVAGSMPKEPVKKVEKPPITPNVTMSVFL